jgi:hypothetical protein
MGQPNVLRAALTLVLALPAAGAPAQQVTLPLPLYEALRARANPAAEVEPPPSAPFAVESDEVEVRAGAAAARVVQSLWLTLYSGDWQSITLGEAGSFLNAELGDLDGRVVATDGAPGVLYVRDVRAVRGQGRHRVRLESVVPVTRDESATRPTWRFALRLPPAGVVRGTIAAADLGAAVEDLELEGGLLAAERAGGARWAFAAPPSAALQITLLGKPTLPARARLPLRFAATAATATALSRTQLRVHGWVEARVAQGRLAELRVALPASFEVASASGPIAAWKVAGGELVITPLAPVEDSLTVEVELKGPLLEAFATPLLLPAGAAHLTLLAKAGVAGDGVLRLADAGSARPAEPEDLGGLGARVRDAAGRLYRILDARRPPRWQAEWAERTAVLASEVDGLWVEAVLGEAGRASYQLWAAVRNHGAQALTIKLPAGFELEEASRDGLSIVPGAPGTGGSIVPGAPGSVADAAAGFVVPLLTRDTPQLIYVSGVLPLALPRGNGDLAVPLPALSAPAARLEVRVLLPAAGRSYALADPSRAGDGGPPPRPIAAAKPATAIGKQLLTKRGQAAGVAASPLSRPIGFAELLASWSALSANPAPLAIHVKSAKEDNPWF